MVSEDPSLDIRTRRVELHRPRGQLKLEVQSPIDIVSTDCVQNLAFLGHGIASCLFVVHRICTLHSVEILPVPI
jgi:hypothetical protein